MNIKGILCALCAISIMGCGDGSSDSKPEPSPETPVIPGPSPDPTPEPEPEPEPEPAPDNHATLSWAAPITRVNGDSISMGELSHYLVFYGTRKDDLSTRIKIDDASIEPDQSVRIDNLGEGTWYFAIKVVDTENRESELSEIVSKTIQL